VDQKVEWAEDNGPEQTLSQDGTSPAKSAFAESADDIQLSIVIPTFNERDNVVELCKRVDDTMKDVPWEIIFVDDNSPDGTSDVVRELARSDRRIRCLQRIGRRGLSSACIEGIMGSVAPYIAVMDADLQHDETILPKMLEALKAQDIDVAVGSRYIEGGGVGEWGAWRVRASKLATWLSHKATRVKLSDPMSGFFAVRRDRFSELAGKLSATGFKILLDIFVSAPRTLRFVEIPYEFRERQHGESKLDARVAWEYLIFLAHRLSGGVLPSRFIGFSAVGGLGLGVHLAVLSLLFQIGKIDFVSAQIVATIMAMFANFILNNALTYRDRRLSGIAILGGLLSFMAACSVGAVANVAVAAWMFDRGISWVLAATGGVIIGAVWNYAITSVFTWGSSSK
jgi:dolichol-phosphate mannosyltransferase